MEIHYVCGHDLDKKDPILRKVIEFCDQTGIAVVFRKYDSSSYNEDAEYITSLPAIQVYTLKVYRDTVYPLFKPIQFLRLEFDKFQLEEFERESKQQIWEERLTYLKTIFKSLKTDSKCLKPEYV